MPKVTYNAFWDEEERVQVQWEVTFTRQHLPRGQDVTRGVTGHLWLPLCAGNGGQSGPVDSCHRDTFVMSRCLSDELALGVAFGLKTGW